jgi:sulfur dioxygenase
LKLQIHADHITGASALRVKTGSRILVPQKTEAKHADQYLSDGDVVSVGNDIKLQCFETPGHTSGCMSYFYENGPLAFTGDALLIRGCEKAFRSSLFVFVLFCV